MSKAFQDFPGGPVVEHLPPSGEDMGMIPPSFSFGKLRSHMLQGTKEACAPQ